MRGKGTELQLHFGARVPNWLLIFVGHLRFGISSHKKPPATHRVWLVVILVGVEILCGKKSACFIVPPQNPFYRNHFLVWTALTAENRSTCRLVTESFEAKLSRRRGSDLVTITIEGCANCRGSRQKRGRQPAVTLHKVEKAENERHGFGSAAGTRTVAVKSEFVR
jgi:hypothetical protein